MAVYDLVQAINDVFVQYVQYWDRETAKKALKDHKKMAIRVGRKQRCFQKEAAFTEFELSLGRDLLVTQGKGEDRQACVWKDSKKDYQVQPVRCLESKKKNDKRAGKKKNNKFTFIVEKKTSFQLAPTLRGKKPIYA